LSTDINTTLFKTHWRQGFELKLSKSDRLSGSTSFRACFREARGEKFQEVDPDALLGALQNLKYTKKSD
jgi:hypothetical protein